MKILTKLLLSLSLVSLLTPIASSADSIQSSDMGATGERLLEQCEITEAYIHDREMKDALNVGLCTGLIQGTILTINSLGEGDSIATCSGQITTEKAVMLVVKYLRKHPMILAEKNAAELIIQSLQAASCETTGHQ